MAKTFSLLVFFVMSIVLSLHAQASVDMKLSFPLSYEANSMRGGDVMNVYEIPYETSLSEIQSVVKESSKSELRYTQNNQEYIDEHFNSSWTNYSQSKKSVFKVGEGNNLYALEYVIPEKVMAYPFCANDSVHGAFLSTGNYCNKWYLRQYGTYVVKVTPLLSPLFNDGNKISMMKLESQRVIGTQSYPIDTLKHSIPPYTADSVYAHIGKDNNLEREIITKYYLEGYRYPVVVRCCKRDFFKGTIMASHQYVILPEEQSQLPLDAYNMCKREQVVAQNPMDVQAADDSIPYSFSYDPTSKKVNCIFREDKKDLDFIVADSRGIVYNQIHKKNYKQGDDVHIDCSNLKNGQYVIYIHVGKNNYSEKNSVK